MNSILKAGLIILGLVVLVYVINMYMGKRENADAKSAKGHVEEEEEKKQLNLIKIMLLNATFALHVEKRAIGVMIVIGPGILSYNQRVTDAVELDINPINAIILIIITDGYRSTC